MLSRKILNISAFIAVSLWSWVPIAWSGSPSTVEDQARYLPIQSISYEFGSKSMSGYFVEKAATCLVTLMIIEKIDPEKLLPLTPTRVRLVLYPGQVAGLDSEEGRSLNFTCGEDATVLLVNVGERERLVELQALAAEKNVAQRH
jgi:hypothetical protein